MAFSFATTYALGQVARRYYGGGRVMSTAVLRDSFEKLLGPAKQMQTQYLPQIQQQVSTLDMGRIMSMVRGCCESSGSFITQITEIPGSHPVDISREFC